MTRAVVVAVTLTACLAGALGQANAHETCAAMPSANPALATIDGEARLRFIEDVMRDQARRARLWNRAWTGVGLTISAGNFGLAALTTNSDDRTDRIIGGVTSLVAPALFLFNPHRVMRNQAKLEALLLHHAPNDGATCLFLERAEQLLAHSAADEASRSRVIRHVLALTVNVALGLIVAVGLEHVRGGIVMGGGGSSLRKGSSSPSQRAP